MGWFSRKKDNPEKPKNPWFWNSCLCHSPTGWRVDINYLPKKVTYDGYTGQISTPGVLLHTKVFKTVEEATEYLDNFGEDFKTWCQFIADLQKQYNRKVQA